MKFSSLLLIAFIFLMPFAINAQSYDFIPLGISYQGILTDSQGDPVMNGTHAMRFYIYDDSTSGSILWRQPSDGLPAQQVETINGIFTVVLGTNDHNLFSTVINENPYNRWLQVEVAGEFLNPRTRLLSKPFSYRSVIADSCRKAVNATHAESSAYSLEAFNAIYSDTSNYSHNTDSLGGLSRSGYVEEGEPNVIDGSMIIDGSIMSEDIGFSAFHDVYYTFEENSFTQVGNGLYQDIDGLSLDLDIASDSTLVYISMSIHNLYATVDYAQHLQICVDDVSVIEANYTINGVWADETWYTSNIDQIVILDTGPHTIKGQFALQSPNTISGHDRNLIAIILK